MVRAHVKQTPEEKKSNQKPKVPSKGYTPEIGSWPCKIDGCNKIFAREADLKRHQRTTKSHSAPSFPCLQCNATFTRTDALRRHQKSRNHGNTPNVQLDSPEHDDTDDDRSDESSPASSKSSPTPAPYPYPYAAYVPGHPPSLPPPPAILYDPHYPHPIALPTSAARLHPWPPPPLTWHVPAPSTGSAPPQPPNEAPGEDLEENSSVDEPQSSSPSATPPPAPSPPTSGPGAGPMYRPPPPYYSYYPMPGPPMYPALPPPFEYYTPYGYMPYHAPHNGGVQPMQSLSPPEERQTNDGSPADGATEDSTTEGAQDSSEITSSPQSDNQHDPATPTRDETANPVRPGTQEDQDTLAAEAVAAFLQMQTRRHVDKTLVDIPLPHDPQIDPNLERHALGLPSPPLPHAHLTLGNGHMSAGMAGPESGPDGEDTLMLDADELLTQESLASPPPPSRT